MIRWIQLARCARSLSTIQNDLVFFLVSLSLEWSVELINGYDSNLSIIAVHFLSRCVCVNIWLIWLFFSSSSKNSFPIVTIAFAHFLIDCYVCWLFCQLLFMRSLTNNFNGLYNTGKCHAHLSNLNGLTSAINLDCAYIIAACHLNLLAFLARVLSKHNAITMAIYRLRTRSSLHYNRLATPAVLISSSWSS